MSEAVLVGSGLSHRFGGLLAIDNVNISIARNEIVGLLGPNGAGKTTLFNILAGYYTPGSGRVLLGGKDVTSWSMAQRARAGIGRTFQIVRPFRSLSVLENLLAPVSGENASLAARKAMAMDALQRLGLAERAQDPAGSLPLGMLKRLEVARALMLKPRIVLLDEPLAGLAVQEAANVLVLARTLAADAGVVIVEHNIRLTLPVCDRAIVLDRGRIISEGPPDVVRRDPKVIAAYLELKMLSLEKIGVSYGLARVVDDVSIEVEAGEWVAIVGANGAGKTSTLRAVMGLIPHDGRVRLGGRDLTALPAWTRHSAGLGFVPEGRQLFPEMTVEENLRVGAYGSSSGKIRAGLEQVHTLFPRLSDRRSQLAHTLSGGEQQMLAIGRALMSQPSVLVIDEVSWGLMPILVQEVFSALALLNANGLTILQVEQNVFIALKHAKRAYVMATGKVVMSGTAAAIQSDAVLLESYIG